MNHFEPLEKGEVLSVSDSALILIGHRTFRVSELSEALRLQLEYGISGWSDERSRWFSEDGIECEVLRFTADGWQKGRVRINLEFRPIDPTEEANSLVEETPDYGGVSYGNDLLMGTVSSYQDDPIESPAMSFEEPNLSLDSPTPTSDLDLGLDPAMSLEDSNLGLEVAPIPTFDADLGLDPAMSFEEPNLGLDTAPIPSFEADLGLESTNLSVEEPDLGLAPLSEMGLDPAMSFEEPDLGLDTPPTFDPDLGLESPDLSFDDGLNLSEMPEASEDFDLTEDSLGEDMLVVEEVVVVVELATSDLELELELEEVSQAIENELNLVEESESLNSFDLSDLGEVNDLGFDLGAEAGGDFDLSGLSGDDSLDFDLSGISENHQSLDDETDSLLDDVWDDMNNASFKNQ